MAELKRERVLFWDAVNTYVEACGGDTSDGTVSGKRMLAVTELERALEQLVRAGATIAAEHVADNLSPSAVLAPVRELAHCKHSVARDAGHVSFCVTCGATFDHAAFLPEWEQPTAVARACKALEKARS
jgi:hypothetical protein